MIGAIDAGSNAIRIVIAQVTATDVSEIVRVEEERVPVRLGHNAFTSGTLTAATIDATVAAFVGFRARFDHHDVTLHRAVATSALRTATNRAVLLHRLHHETGIDVDVIPGDEEAALVRAAVLHAMGAQTTPNVILDLGGGSLEVNLRHGTVWRGTSLPVGTVRLMETFGLDGPIGDAEAAMVRRYTATLMQPVAARSASGDAIAAITGGNAEALAKIFGDGHPTTPSFDVEELERGLPRLIATGIDERMDSLGIKRDRAEVIGIAALVFSTAARALGVRRLVSAGVGLRDGVLLELASTARDQQVVAAGLDGKALVVAARAFARRLDHNGPHGEHVRFLASELFHQLRDVHELPEDRGALLEVAAVLHDVGEVVNSKGHHKHSEYLIRCGRIPGLDGVDREMVALMARCHRKDAAAIRTIIADSSLRKEHRVQLRKLTALLRIADSLDSAHRSRVHQILCTRMGNSIVLDVLVHAGGSPGDGSELVRKSDFLAEALGLDVRITVAVAPPSAP
jgi:exopolyphosphatase/guanosine-5'-triphosphate,3'-diphosphate pyrophosphatase